MATGLIIRSNFWQEEKVMEEVGRKEVVTKASATSVHWL